LGCKIQVPDAEPREPSYLFFPLQIFPGAAEPVTESAEVGTSNSISSRKKAKRRRSGK